MKLIEDFRLRKPDIIKYIDKNGLDMVSLYAATSGIPLIAIWTYIAEEHEDYRERCNFEIDTLVKFYGYVLD